MKSKKRRFESFSFYDHTGIEKHLVKMAAKGWLIERISNFGWVYRRIEPKNLKFTVNYYPWASNYEPAPSEDQQTLLDFCAHTGWQLACTWSTMQVFYNEQPEPVPIDTDPMIQLRNIYEGCERSFTNMNVRLIILVTLIAVMLHDSTDGFIDLLSGSSNLVIILLGTTLLTMALIDLAVYFIWYHKALKATNQGAFLPTKGTASAHKAASVLTGLILILWLARMFTDKFTAKNITYILCIFTCILITFIINLLREYFKKRRLPSTSNRILTTLIAFFIWLLIAGAIVYAFSAGMNGKSDFVLEERNQLAPAEIGLTMEELIEESSGNYSSWGTVEESLLLRKETVYLSLSSENEPALSAKYMIVTLKVPWLYNLCKEDLLSSASGRIYGTQLSINNRYEPMEILPKGTLEGYRLHDGEGQAHNTYILCCENQLIQIGFSWSPSPQVLETAFYKLIQQ